MRILIAPDKFKGSLTALDVCEAIAAGIHSHDSSIEIDFHPLADGGDGSVEILAQHLDLQAVYVPACNPRGQRLLGRYFVSKTAAFIELATTSGIVLLEDEDKNPRRTTTFGTGLVLRDALEKGFTEIYLFLGGSATNDGGIGLATALGFVFLSKTGGILPPIGESLGRIASIDTSKTPFDFSKIHITALCDVANPLYGPNGAAYVYAPQKGASPSDVEFLDKGLQHLALMVQNTLNIDMQNIKGGGAAGGIAAGLVAFCQAKLVEGSTTIMNLTNFEKKLNQADWVLSGEGRLDKQTLEGKVVQAVLQKAAGKGKRTGLFVGSCLLSSKEIKALNLDYLGIVLDSAPSVEDAMERGAVYLRNLGAEFAKSLMERPTLSPMSPT